MLTSTVELSRTAIKRLLSLSIQQQIILRLLQAAEAFWLKKCLLKPIGLLSTETGSVSAVTIREAIVEL